MANCAPTYEPIIILTIIKPYTKSTWPKIIKRTNAPKLEAKFKTFALPATQKSNPNISKTNNIKEPVPPPKKPS